MKKILLLAVVLAAIMTEDVIAEDGNYIYTKGQEYIKVQNKEADRNHFHSAYFMGYISGVVDSISRKEICFPAGVTTGQLFDISYNILRDHPEDRHFAGASIISHYLKIKFPCDK